MTAHADHDLAVLARAAQDAAERAIASIDDAPAFVEASSQRSAAMQAMAKPIEGY